MRQRFFIGILSIFFLAGVGIALNPSLPARAMAVLFPTGEPAEFEHEALDTFAHPDYPFSVAYPGNLTILHGPDSGGEVVLFQDAGRVIFQIFIQPHQGPEPLTAELIRAEFPDRVVGEVHALTLADGTPVVAFESIDPTAGRYFEAWFAHAGHAYHVAAELAQQALVEELLTETWQFE